MLDVLRVLRLAGDEPPKDAPQDNKSPQGKGRSARKKLFVTSKNDYLRSPR